MPTRVVHCKREPYDVYIGRGSMWGNDWSHKTGTQAKYVVATVEEAVRCYKEWLLSHPDMVQHARATLKDKVLGCWCKFKGHEPCHGDVLAEVANSCS